MESVVLADVNGLDLVVSVAIGLGLAAASGFRVFVPLLALGFAARGGYVPLSSGFEWVGSTPAVLAFGAATLIEIGAYYVPWLDNALDVVAAPAAVLAGIIASASVLVDVPPLLKWSIAIIAGGAAAGAVQASTSLLRLKSTAITGGLGNPLLATFELGGAVVTAILAILLPLVAIAVVIVVLLIVYRLSRRLVRRAPHASA